MNEEDIKNLSEIIELCEEEINNNDENVTAILDLTDLKSLRNLINRNKELEEKNKHLSSTSDYETICLECNNLEEQLEIANDKIKELEIEISRIPYFNKCWDTIYEMAVKNFESKIIAKIEELKQEGNYKTIENPNGRVHFQLEPCDYKIQVLEELLQEGK